MIIVFSIWGIFFWFLTLFQTFKCWDDDQKISILKMEIILDYKLLVWAHENLLNNVLLTQIKLFEILSAFYVRRSQKAIPGLHLIFLIRQSELKDHYFSLQIIQFRWKSVKFSWQENASNLRVNCLVNLEESKILCRAKR